MKSILRWVMMVLLSAALFAPGKTNDSTSTYAKRLFAQPPRQYSTAPLWVWNDQLTKEEIVSTMMDLSSQKVKQVFVHPRPGLMTPYLSEEWFRLWKVALAQAERLDMNVWIYDENSYPSGFAGGFVPESMPESRGRGLVFREEKQMPEWTNSILAAYRITDQGFENLTERVRAGDLFVEGRYLIASVVRATDSPWHGGKCYVDLLYPGVTERFLDITLEAYRRKMGSEFGRRIPGVFTDEPHLLPAGGLPWTDALPQVFARQWGYSLLDHLPSLHMPLGEWGQVRHDYYQTLLELFIERWAKPYHDYCATNHLEFTGHYWEHEWPNCTRVPDNMALYAWHQRPAIDILMNQYQEDTHAQFGNVRSVKELSSVANQCGYPRTLCEAYGAGGWDLRFEDMKRIGDWLYVLGVNTLAEHLSYITIRGARKRDHPQSFSYHEPWWEAYHVNAEYFSRLSAALSQGRQINHVLVIEPTTTVWMYNGDKAAALRLESMGKSFQNLVFALEKAQAEYDLGCEDIMARHGSTATNALMVGQQSYSIVVLPPFLENLNAKTMDLLEQFVQKGGTVLGSGPPPACVEGRRSDRGLILATNSGWQTLDVGLLPAAILGQQASGGFSIQQGTNATGLLFHHRRQLADGQLLFLVNTSLELPAAGWVDTTARGVEEWNPYTGAVGPYAFEKAAKGSRFSFELSPGGSRLLFLSEKPLRSAPAVPEKTMILSAAGPAAIRRLGPNVLLLDYVDVTVGGLNRLNMYYYRAGQLAFQKNKVERNPWDSAVQFRDEFTRRIFPATSGLDVNYRFTIKGPVLPALDIVIERPDLYKITCNGRLVVSQGNRWWLDKSFGRMYLTPWLRPGENVVRLNAAPFSMFQEIEPVYLLGEFALQSTDNGFVITADKALDFGPWNRQGHPFYSAGVNYAEPFKLAAVTGRYLVSVDDWYGSVARIIVNGHPVDYLTHQPWEVEVTRWMRKGENRIELEVMGTLKNTLGPHHNKPGLGSAWPSMFQAGPETGPPPGAEYSTVGYGLFKPFVLKQMTH